jgi:probable F420-dependent oxidoreductase
METVQSGIYRKEHTMKFGLSPINMGVCSHPEVMTRVAQAAEAAGFDSLWVGEHVVLPVPRTPASPMDPQDPVLDPVVTLTFLAAQTRRILLGTGIIILPQRNPLVLAKELASLDVLSGGRLILGIGVGYLEPEFRALGVPLEDRGKRADEYLAAMQAIWSEGQPSYHGQFVSFANVQAYPLPIQRPHPPIVVGGHTPASYRRAVEKANGWYGYNFDLERTAEAITGLRRASERYERPTELGTLEISVTPARMVGHAMVEQYAALGVHRLILRPPHTLDGPGLEQFVRTVGTSLIERRA